MREEDNNTSIKKNFILIVVIYTLLFVLVTIFHEPWFDEAQAWEIGKTATYKEIFTVVTHTEGHPPLWSFILSIPAKLGVPFYLGLKGISLLFSLAVVYLVEFKSPFPRIIKYLLPFSYFLFYQYGVISRTYCVMELALVLIAIMFKKRDQNPRRFIGALYLLCLTSIYGILIAAGICVCWVYDLLFEYRKKGGLFIVKDKRLRCLLVLFFAVLPIVYYIIPPDNASAMDLVSNVFSIKRFLYFLFIMPGDTFVSVTEIPSMASIDLINLVPGFTVTMIMYFMIWLVSGKKDIKYYIFPYVFYSIFMCFYGSGNHTGIGMIWFLSYIWAVYEEKSVNEKCIKLVFFITNILKHKPSQKLLVLIKAIPVVILGFSVAYCIKISIDDIRLPYCESKAIADFIKEHHMEDANIMIKWNLRMGSTDGEYALFDYNKLDSAYTSEAVAILPYFNTNIFFNHNISNHEKCYLTHLKSTEEEKIETYKLWQQYGIPEVLVGLPMLSVVYGNDISITDYVPVATVKGYYMGKNRTMTVSRPIYVRKDCLKKFGL